MAVRTHLREVVAGLGCSAAEAVALAVLVAGAVAALGLLWVGARPGQAPPPEPAAPGPLAVQAEPLVVHVAGAVVVPGLYELPGGSRVADALKAAGGPRPDATLEALNLARPLGDGEQLLVPVAAAPGAAAPEPASSPSAARPDGTLDLNRASADELDELPGIGPVLAERIIAHRNATGPFTSVGELRDVPGIGDKTFQELEPLVAV